MPHIAVASDLWFPMHVIQVQQELEAINLKQRTGAACTMLQAHNTHPSTAKASLALDVSNLGHATSSFQSYMQ